MFAVKFNVAPFGDLTTETLGNESLLDAMIRILSEKFGQPVSSMVCQPRAAGTSARYKATLADMSIHDVTILAGETRHYIGNNGSKLGVARDSLDA